MWSASARQWFNSQSTMHQHAALQTYPTCYFLLSRTCPCHGVVCNIRGHVPIHQALSRTAIKNRFMSPPKMSLLPVLSCLFDTNESGCATERGCAAPAASFSVIHCTSSTDYVATADRLGRAAVEDEKRATM